MTIHGVTFDNVWKILAYMFYGDGIDTDKALWNKAKKYIIPMKSNFFNPIEADSKDTYIQFFIESDRRYIQDGYDGNTETLLNKVATVLLRFSGAQAEMWAKSMHHLRKRTEVAQILWEVASARLMEDVGEIRPAVTEFFGKNAVIAFDVRMKLHYRETIDLDWKVLQQVSIGPGTVKTN